MRNLYPSIPDDFEATIRIFRADEGGRTTATFNGLRWDLNYAEEDAAARLYMIWPDFFGSGGASFPIDRPLPVDERLNARMFIVVDEMRAQVHRSRLDVGTRFYCCEGSRRVAEGQVTRITGLHFDRVPASTMALSAEATAKVEAMILAGRPLDAIKFIRDATGMGLSEAKAHMESIIDDVVRRRGKP